MDVFFRHRLKYTLIRRNVKIQLIPVLVLLVSLIVMGGWIWEFESFLRVFPSAPTMKFNAALLFSLAAIGVLVHSKRGAGKILQYLISGIIFIIGFLSIFQYAFNFEFGIDNIFVNDKDNIPYPGRMARTTAVCFTLFGLALLFSTFSNKKLKNLGAYFLAFISLISILALLTYAMQALTSSHVLIFNSMAFHSAICFFLLSGSLSLANPGNTFIDLFSGQKIGSRLARRLIPFLIILPLLLGFVMLYVTGINGVNTDVGITIYTICFSIFGLVYASWVAYSLDREDEQRQVLENSLIESNKQLKENIRFKKQLVRTSPETILILNLNTQTVRYINKDIYPEVGLTKERILGVRIEEMIPYIHPRDRQKVLEFHKNILKSSEEEVFDIEIRLKLKDNLWEWFSVRGKVFERKNPEWVNEYVILVRNISSIKVTQKALINAEKFSIMGEVAQTLAHELRNPITSIGMATEIISKKVEGDVKNDLEKYLVILKRSGKTLNELVTNLLNASNYTETVLAEHNIVEIIEYALAKASDRIYLTGIEVIKNYSGYYPILADKEKVSIALLNIIVNACEAVVPEQGVIEISVKDSREDVILTISDNGPGVDKEQLERLFDVFYTTKNSGVGVGLNSVKNILDEHDAKIEVMSKKNEGACFKIYFPIHKAAMKLS